MTDRTNNGDWAANRKLVLAAIDRHGKNLTTLFGKVDEMQKTISRHQGFVIGLFSLATIASVVNVFITILKG